MSLTLDPQLGGTAMEERTGGGGGESSRLVAPKVLVSGDRQVFTVELTPGETTYVSWKKLVKDANRLNGSSASAPEPTASAHLNHQSGVVPEVPAEKEVKDEAPNRFSAVIEKIERLYMGKDSSDEEELDDAPDDDQYDTEDSFIDDTELDEYFEVDNSAIKHGGFFVNRGKLERIESAVVSNQQPKKRRRKDGVKSQTEFEDGRVSNKQVKISKTAAGKSDPSLAKNYSTSPVFNPTKNTKIVNMSNSGDMNAQSASGISARKNSSDSKIALGPSSYFKASDGDSSVPRADVMNNERANTGVPHSKSVAGNKSKDGSGSSDVLHHKFLDRNTQVQYKSQDAKSSSKIHEYEQPLHPKEKNGVRELPDLNISENSSMQSSRTSNMQKQDGSTTRSKVPLLEKAIRDLEKMVAELRPPTIENQETDAAAQGIKRRLPREIKLKLAKVARIAQASQGKISKELLNRLMGILGHLIQLRSLKRNLNIMINTSLSAKQEKDVMFQQKKKEVAEMIKTRMPSLESKAIEQQPGASDDFQEICAEEIGVLKRKFNMDAALEDKICDLYDLYVDGLDEDVRPQIRKLYIELAALWPNGLMDKSGIKQAICMAKERKRAVYSKDKDREKIKRKKIIAPKPEDRGEPGLSTQQHHAREKLASDSIGQVLASTSKPTPSSAGSAVRMQSPSTHDSSLDRIKPDKLRGSSSNATEDLKLVEGGVAKKKVKRKTEIEIDENHLRPEKITVQQVDEKHKSWKHGSGIPQKSDFQPAAPASFGQPS